MAIILDARLWHFLDGSGQEIGSRYETTIRGIYKALWEDGISADFLEGDAIPERAARYRALVFPYPISVGGTVIDALRSCVRDGGALIAEACAGRYDDETFGVPGEMAPGFAELFGAENKELNVLPAAGAHMLTGAGDFDGMRVAATACLQFLAPTSGKPILMCGDEVAGSVNAHGKGRAYLVGTLLGRPVAESDDPRNRNFLSAMLRHAGVPSGMVGKLQRKRRILGNKQAWFLFNCTRETVEETVSLEGFRSATDLLDIALPVADGRARVVVEPMDIRCLIVEG